MTPESHKYVKKFNDVIVIWRQYVTSRRQNDAIHDVGLLYSDVLTVTASLVTLWVQSYDVTIMIWRHDHDDVRRHYPLSGAHLLGNGRVRSRDPGVVSILSPSYSLAYSGWWRHIYVIAPWWRHVSTRNTSFNEWKRWSLNLVVPTISNLFDFLTVLHCLRLNCFRPGNWYITRINGIDMHWLTAKAGRKQADPVLSYLGEFHCIEWFLLVSFSDC